MKEAYGNAFSIWLFMMFFVIYVCFIAVALQFAKTYRVKNYVINVLEQYQYSGDVNDKALNQLDYYLGNVPYKISDEDAKSNCDENGVVHNGVCIIQEGTEDAKYYKVIVYFVAEFPFLEIAKLTIPVSGETTVINPSFKEID